VKKSKISDDDAKKRLRSFYDPSGEFEDVPF